MRVGGSLISKEDSMDGRVTKTIIFLLVWSVFFAGGTLLLKKGAEAEKGPGEIAEEKELLNEDFGASFVIVVILPFFFKLMGGVALSAAVAKGGAWWAKHAGEGDASERLDKLGDLLEWLTKMLVTGGVFRGADKIVNWYFGKKCQQLQGYPQNPDALECSSEDLKTRRKWKTRINVTEKVIV